jgi:hypothetical protein
MGKILRWLKKNWSSASSLPSANDPRTKTERELLHENWWDDFESEMRRWS